MSKKARRKQRRKEQPRPNQKTRRRMQRLAEQAMESFMTAAGDPEVLAEQPARALLALFEGRRPTDGLAFVIAKRSSPARVQAVGEAAVEIAPESLTSLAFAAEAAECARDDRRGAELYERAVAVDDEPVLRWCWAVALTGLEDVRAFEVLEPLLADPTDAAAQDVYRDALEIAFSHRELDAPDDCPCGSGYRYGYCCAERERIALESFADASTLDELRAALDGYASRAEYARSARRLHGDFFGEDDDRNPDEHDLFAALRVRMITTPQDELVEDDDVGLLADLLRDDSVAPELRRRAADLKGYEHWGLWQVADPQAAPGVWVTDLLSAQRHYVQIAPELLERLAPWSVLLGSVVPVEGVWRVNGALPLNPREADRAAEVALDTADLIIESERHSARRRSAYFSDWLEAGPPGVVARERSPMPQELESFLSTVVSGGIVRIIDAIREWRATPPRLTNTDGEALHLQKVRVALGHAAALETLAGHSDFELRDDEIVWLGRVMSASEAASARAEFEAMCEREGLEPSPEVGDEQRYVRAFIERDGDELVFDVNSDDRLEALVAVLQDIGADPTLLSAISVDPFMDFVPSTEASAGAGMSPGAQTAWQEAWLDEEVPALGGLTPRQAAGDDEGRLALEALLRDFEHRSAHNRAAGRNDIDVEALRAELGMELVGGPLR
ncbi:MAG: hypothetical protein ACRDK3_04405 [Actinomycetota bacterium]